MGRDHRAGALDQHQNDPRQPADRQDGNPVRFRQRGRNPRILIAHHGCFDEQRGGRVQIRRLVMDAVSGRLGGLGEGEPRPGRQTRDQDAELRRERQQIACLVTIGSQTPQRERQQQRDQYPLPERVQESDDKQPPRRTVKDVQHAHDSPSTRSRLISFSACSITLRISSRSAGFTSAPSSSD